jgi:hypothetical protein
MDLTESAALVRTVQELASLRGLGASCTLSQLSALANYASRYASSLINAFISATANGFAKNAFMPASTASDRAEVGLCNRDLLASVRTRLRARETPAERLDTVQRRLAARAMTTTLERLNARLRALEPQSDPAPDATS